VNKKYDLVLIGGDPAGMAAEQIVNQLDN